VSSLRDTLTEDDRSLLVLRGDRDLSWKDLALVLADEDGAGPSTIRRWPGRPRACASAFSP
jgi:hypothetical protein